MYIYQMYRILTLAIFLLVSSGVCAQEWDFHYTHADTLSMRVQYHGKIYYLTRELTAPCSGQVQKARAIFVWITNSIAYDYKAYNRQVTRGYNELTFRCPSDDTLTCVIKEKVWENQYINRALDRKKVVCQGYAMLFKRMCGIAGIHAEVIPGYTRTAYYQVGTPGELDHVWNAVQLDGKYYLLDPTWAAGSCSKDDNDRLNSFEKLYNDFYWLTPPEEFAKDHFPEDPKWTLLPKYSIEKFSANPYYDPGELSRITLLAPSSGMIKAKKGDTIRFKLKYMGRINKLQINTNIFTNPDTGYYEDHKRHELARWIVDSLAVKRQQYVPFKRTGLVYEFVYVVRDYTLEYLDILFDRYRVMRFKIDHWR